MRNKFLALAVILCTAFIFTSCCSNNSCSKKDDTCSKEDSCRKKDDSSCCGEKEKDKGTMEVALPADFPTIPAEAKVFFKNLKDGQTVTSPLKIEMGVEGMKVEPAGKAVQGFGHHHLIIDGEKFEKLAGTVPADSTHIHFGKGQTETTINLPKGKHQLSLQFADGLHRSYGEQMATTIDVIVK